MLCYVSNIYDYFYAGFPTVTYMDALPFSVYTNSANRHVDMLA